MAYRLKPGRQISPSVRDVGRDQIDRVLAQFSSKTSRGTAVHEARKSMKRLRALLHLVKPAMPKGSFAVSEARLKKIGRSLSGARDAQAMLETVRKLEAHDGSAKVKQVTAALRAKLQAECAEAEHGLTGAGIKQLRKLLNEAKAGFAEMSLEPDDFSVVAVTLERDYRKARHAFSQAYRLRTDEAFHDWRKRVQRHWRQLLLVTPSWPKAIRPHAALARNVSEALGEDHDLAVLAARVKAEADQLGDRNQIEAYIALCRTRQAELRRIAHELGTRLLSEKPGSLARRVSAYWATAETVDEETPSVDLSGNVIALIR